MFKFWKLYGAMKNKHKSMSILDFQREDNIWVRTDEEKGEALFSRYLKQTNQDNELERRNMLNNIQMHFDDDQDVGIELTTDTVRRTIMSGNDTAPGPVGFKKHSLKTAKRGGH